MRPLLAPAPGFDDPLEMLQACHGRIEVQCATLLRLVEHLTTQGCDTQARQAARAVLRYFDSAGRHHHEDEEADLFPMLLATKDSTASVLVSRLLAEHQKMDAAWRELRPQLKAIDEELAGSLEAGVAQHFCQLYAAHIALENGQLLPLAARLLTAEQQCSLGHSMAARRGVSR